MSAFKHTLILIALVILLGIMYVLTSGSMPVPGTPAPVDDGGGIACTMDAMMCPDGTYVGRSGPNCQFVCPTPSATSSTSLYEKITIGLNEPKTIGDTTIKAWAVTQDSRCPSDVTCIQAGKATVAFTLTTPAGESIKELEVGGVMTTESLSITLDEVQPYPISTRKTQDNEYRFVLSVRSK